MKSSAASRPLNALSMAYIALFAVLISVCSWISIPSFVPFTMQTFGIFCALGLLGGKRGLLAVLVYLLMGVAGLPVFSEFRGGVGHLLGTTGGYLIGFVFLALIYWLVTRLFGTKLWVRAAGMLLGMVTMYAFGTAWFVTVYAAKSGPAPVSIATALGWCVFPFLLPDLLKLALALLTVRRLGPHVKLP